MPMCVCVCVARNFWGALHTYVMFVCVFVQTVVDVVAKGEQGRVCVCVCEGEIVVVDRRSCVSLVSVTVGNTVSQVIVLTKQKKLS